jgi:hypothetical protein
MAKAEIWLRGMAAAVISGGANGAITGFAAIGIDPSHFNLAAGFGHTLSLAGVSSIMSAIIGVAAYLKQSPLPCDPGWGDSDGGAWQHAERQPERQNDRRPGGSAGGAGDDRGNHADNRGRMDHADDRQDDRAGGRVLEH